MDRELRTKALKAEAALADLMGPADAPLWPEDYRCLQQALAIVRGLAR